MSPDPRSTSGVSFKTVEKSFKVTGISDKLDKTEDGLFWDRGECEHATRSEDEEDDEGED